MNQKQSTKDRLKEITAQIEVGIRELFESDRYQDYLRTMSRFHNYSLNNTMLIFMQKPDATLVAGFNKWRDQFHRTVNKGEKAIRILAPTPYKKKIEQTKLDPDTKLPLLDQDGKVITEEKEIKIPMYKPVPVFDVSQTSGEPLPSIVSELNGNVKNYEMFMEALHRSSPVPITIKEIEQAADGFFNFADQAITLRAGMSEVQTICAAIHEIAHAKLHNPQNPVSEEEKSRRTQEIEAESIAFTVCQYYDIDTVANSLGYIATWSQDKSLKELRNCLEVINKTSSKLISDIEHHLLDIRKERNVDLQAEIEQDSITKLASDMIQFTEKYDPYEYYDTVENGKHTVQELIESISAGHVQEIRDWFEPLLTNADDVYYVEAQVLMNRLNNLVPKENEVLYLVDDTNYLHIQEIDGGFDYSIYDKSTKKLLDGGCIESSEIEESSTKNPLAAVRSLVFEAQGLTPTKVESADLQILEELHAVNERLMTKRATESRFENAPNDSYCIYQLNENASVELRFASYDRLNEPPVREHYDAIYTDALPQCSSTIETLEHLYETFNISRPENYKGHSLSISDIVALKQHDVISYHYCDRIGFKQLSDFNHMKTAEELIEDDYNMIDGTINNGKREPIAEKAPKESVLTKLKAIQQDSKEQKPMKKKERTTEHDLL